MPVMRSSSLSRALTMMMGTALASRMRAHSVRPSVPAIVMSSITMSAGWVWNACHSASPSAKSRTAKPSLCRNVLISARMLGSSSAM